MDQHPLPDIDPYVNRNLFSDHFLKELLPQDESWQVDEDRLKLAVQAATNLYAGREEEWAGSNEPQLENRLVRPMLQALGHKFEVQPSLRTPETVRRPDYAFFGTDEERLKAKRDHDGQAEYFNKAIAIGDAKRWDRSLDKKERSGRDSFDMLSPSWQIDYYLRMSGVKWGILTNGRLWRLYNQETSFRLDICYEIDLPRLLAAKNLEHFKYFYLFFTRQAFVPDAEGLCFLDRVYQGSLEYAQAVGDDLKENVYKALRLLAEGFLHTQGNNLDPVHDLDEIHANSLVLLYRLLFTNYAEDRGLLPRDNALYKESYGLVSMEREIASKLQRGDSLSPFHTTYWGKLKTLFDLINRGTERLGVEAETMDVPPYNGGLFDPEKHPFLDQRQVADRWVSQVVDLLARSQGEGVGRGFVDYSSLDVRHLGSIYEGLLEYKLRVAEEEMVAVKRGGKDQWVPASEAEGSRVLDRVEPGSVYLATDKGERKATGSYYTPDYIVKYMAEQTVGRLVEEKMKADDPTEGILSLKVLDPAMGSGHFLVEATDRLAHALVAALGGSDEQQEEEDVRWARREVVERCIYGVDLNPLAVELAKLSLWLHTVAEGKPLNFLDHHLKVGNSLIGAWVEDLGSLPVPRKRGAAKEGQPDVRQMNLFEIRLEEQLPVMLNRVLEIIRRRSDTLDDIKAKAATDEAVEELKAPFKAVADLWVSTYFGNEVTETHYQEALEYIGRPAELMALPPSTRAREIADDQGFFHWELEFPEVFFEDSRKRGNPGFDAVVGNPPYGQVLDRTLKGYLESRNLLATAENWDMYSAFSEIGYRLGNPTGLFSFIIPNTFTIGPWYSGFRDFFATSAHVRQIVNFGHVPVFEDPTTFVAILVASHVVSGEPTMLTLVDSAERFTEGGVSWQTKRPHELLEDIWVVLDRVSSRLLRTATPLSQLCFCYDSGMDYNKKSVARKVFYEGVKQHPRDIRYLRGSSIDRYHLEPEDLWLRHNWRDLVDKEQKENLKVNVAAYQDHPKIYTRQTADRIVASLDTVGYYHQKSLHSTHLKPEARDSHAPEFILALLDSKLATYFYRGLSEQEVNKVYAQVKIDRLRRLPIANISLTTPRHHRDELAEKGRELYERSLSEGHACLLEFANHQLAEERTDVMHDLIVHLAGQMIGMNREKRSEGRGFLDWLGAYTGLGVEEWRLKTVVKAYWEQSWDELRRALRTNRKAIEKASGRNVEGREALEAIKWEFEKSIAKLNPLLERIASTDRLIDLIVYRLYGLTEEEVAIVEKSAT